MVEFELREKKGRFFIKEHSDVLAEMTFVYAGKERIIIDHTEVLPGNNGKGYGRMLVAKAVDYARENNIKILPLCPFAKSVFDKTPEYKAVL